MPSLPAFVRCIPLLVIVCLLATLCVPTPVRAERPRLVLVVSVDQLSQLYLEQFRDNLQQSKMFFGRAEEEGAIYRNCHHQHAFTVTAPGHACLMTGCYPNYHGIVGNNWYDRTTGKDVYCISDPNVKNLSSLPADEKEPETAIGMSPRTLQVETVGDVLKLHSGGKSKVFGLAWKDRAGVLMAGHAADGVFWCQKGEWITSTYYRDDLPGYLRNLNSSKLVKGYATKSWKLLLPIQRYHSWTADEEEGESPPNKMVRSFPHDMPEEGASEYLLHLPVSPFANEITIQVAKELIQAEKLGSDAYPDILCIGLSANDYVGHAFGPQSLEVEDMVYRTDLLLAEFSSWLQQKVGTSWTMIVTSDHGVAPIPKIAADMRLPAGRNPIGAPARVRGQMDDYLRREMKIVEPEGTEEKNRRDLVSKVEANQIYLNRSHPALAGGKVHLAEQLLRDWLLENSRVISAYTREDLLRGGEQKLIQQFQRAWHPRRSGDVLFATVPYMIPGLIGTTHGSPWQYDTHVPLVIVGQNVRKGNFDRQVSPAAIAASVARLLDIPPPATAVEGPLTEGVQRGN